METKVIAIDWTINTWKSTLIKNQQLLYDNKKTLVFPETARWVMDDFPWSENDQDIFQEIIYHRESERLHQIKREVNKWIYDLILVDRTSLSWWIFWMFNQDNWKSTKLNPSVFDPSIYDKVILFNKPIWEYKWSVDAFKWYNDSSLNSLFKKYIPHCFPQTVEFDNYFINQYEVDSEIAKTLWLNFQ